MGRSIRLALLTALAITFGSAILFAQNGHSVPNYGWNKIIVPSTGNSHNYSYRPPIASYFYPSFDYFGGYFSPFLNLPQLGPNYSYLPNYWWTGRYSPEDPRQTGYNPSSGYPSDTVATLLLTTDPANSRITLNGTFIGTNDSLGPIQLPIGEHSLRVEAPGYEPSESILRVERPALEQLEVRLKTLPLSVKAGAKP